MARARSCPQSERKTTPLPPPRVRRSVPLRPGRPPPEQAAASRQAARECCRTVPAHCRTITKRGRSYSPWSSTRPEERAPPSDWPPRVVVGLAHGADHVRLWNYHTAERYCCLSCSAIFRLPGAGARHCAFNWRWSSAGSLPSATCKVQMCLIVAPTAGYTRSDPFGCKSGGHAPRG